MYQNPLTAAADLARNEPPHCYAEEAWLKLLRATHPTQHIYSSDPFVEVYSFAQCLYGLMFPLLDTGGFGWMWLIDGPERAMLIDTGYGLGDLQGLCRDITGGKPLMVANTHCSCDHSYGNCQFSQVYCHELLAADLDWKQDPRIWDYLFQADGSCLCVPFDRRDLVPFRRYQIIGVPDGYRFDLGQGHEVELIWTPGHQPGHAAYLDLAGRFLIGGDCVGCGAVSVSGGSDFHADPRHARDPFQGSRYPSWDPRRTVAAQREGLHRLASRLEAFDRVFCGHGIQDLSSQLIPALLAACNRVLAQPESCDLIQPDGRHCIDVPGGGQLCYYLNGIGKRTDI